MNIESFNSEKHLTYEELVEYSRGNLSNSEMHRLEQHLIGCELCNEALDGISILGFDTADASLERIKEATGTKEAQGFGLYHYVGIAASVLLIAVLGFVFTRSGDESERLAEEVVEAMDEQVAELGTTKEAAVQVDSVEAAATDTTLLAMASSEQEVTPPPTEQPAELPQQIDTTNLIAGQAAAEPEGAGEEVVLADLDMAVTDTSLVTPMVEDSAVIAITEVVDEEEQQAAAKSRMAAPTEAKKVETEPMMSEELSGEYVIAKPTRGMRAYERYLKRNLEYPQAAKDNGIEGEVILTVTINADGSIGEITVATSLGFGCDEEAMRLVREGQAWSPTTRGGTPISDQVAVTVSFKL